MKKQELLDKLTKLNLTIDNLSKRTNTDITIINNWNDTNKLVPQNIIDFLANCEYQLKFQQLQKEFITIKKNAKWFEPHHQAVYDFVIHNKNYAEFTINDYDVIIRLGNKDFGFKHLILRHYGLGEDGEIKALDILKIGNIIKQDVTIPAKGKNKIAFIQNKNNTKYTVILKKEKSGKLLFNFFSDN